MDGEILIDEFRRALGKVAKSGDLVNKAAWLVRTYECFRLDKLPPHKQQQRKQIVAKDLSTQAITKKHVMTLMNKLSPLNKEHIINQVRSIFREDQAELVAKTVWEFMLILPEQQDIYTDVLLILTPHITETVRNICCEWLDKKEWDIDVIETDAEYDAFCDSVKQKKRAVAAVKGFGYFLRKHIIESELYEKIATELYVQCNDLIMHSPRKFEIIIEQFKAILPVVATKFDISQWILLAPVLPPSARFKVYDLRDKNL